MNAPRGPDGAFESYLSLMESQRLQVLGLIAGLDEEALWRRPAPKGWSIGEHLDHTRVLLRSFRCILQLYYALTWPLGWLKRHQPYETEIDDVYQRPSFPTNVGWLWPPRHSARRPISASELGALLQREHERVSAFFLSKEKPSWAISGCGTPPLAV
jgi:hypothetical protein